MSDERRQHYRVSPATEREVRVSIKGTDGQVRSLGLIDISAGGVALACDAHDAPTVKLMDQVSVMFESNRLGQPLEIDSQIRHIQLSEDDKSVMYGVRFLGWKEQRQNLAPKLRALFNEREAVRVDPRDDEEIEVQLVLNGTARAVSGMLRDISILGVGVWVSTEDDALLKTGEEFSLKLSLPTNEEDLEFQVKVCHLQIFGQQARLGVEIQGAGSTRGPQRGITSYVMSRQIEIARIDAERRRAMEFHYPSR